jgi:CheY-like chemotaxis protein
MRILIVDDNALMRRAMVRLLKADGVSVWSAESGPQACQVIAYGSFDVVVTDYEMPGMNGDEVLRFAQKHAKATRRVLTSGLSAEDPEIVRCMAAGLADVFVSKSGDRNEMRDAVLGREEER